MASDVTLHQYRYISGTLYCLPLSCKGTLHSHTPHYNSFVEQAASEFGYPWFRRITVASSAVRRQRTPHVRASHPCSPPQFPRPHQPPQKPDLHWKRPRRPRAVSGRAIATSSDRFFSRHDCRRFCGAFGAVCVGTAFVSIVGVRCSG